MSKTSILSCGEVLWDLFPEGARFGGAPANFACHAALLGGDVALLSAVGQDPRGDEVLAILRRFGIDTSLIQRIAAAPTGRIRSSMPEANNSSMARSPTASRSACTSCRVRAVISSSWS